MPTGYASFPREIRPLPPRALVKKTYRVERFSEFERGGHFAALEQPDLFVGDGLRETGSREGRGVAGRAVLESKNNTERKPMHFARLP